MIDSLPAIKVFSYFNPQYLSNQSLISINCICNCAIKDRMNKINHNTAIIILAGGQSTRAETIKGSAGRCVSENAGRLMDDPACLMAPVHSMEPFGCFSLNPRKLELHKFFGRVCLEVDVFDRKGKRCTPRCRLSRRPLNRLF